jgi:hypothetical protein
MTNHLITIFTLLIGFQSWAQFTPLGEKEADNLAKCGNFHCADSTPITNTPTQPPPKVFDDPLGKKATCARVFAAAPYPKNTYLNLSGFSYILPVTVKALDGGRSITIYKDGFDVEAAPHWSRPKTSYTIRNKMVFQRSASNHAPQVDIFEPTTEIVGVRWVPSPVPMLLEYDTSKLQLQLDNGVMVEYEKALLDLPWDGQSTSIQTSAIFGTRVLDNQNRPINEFDCGLTEVVSRNVSVVDFKEIQAPGPSAKKAKKKKP